MIHGVFQSFVGVRRYDLRMHVTLYVASFGRKEPVYVIRVQDPVGGFVEVKAVFPPDPVGVLLAFCHGFFDFFRQGFRDPLVRIHEQHPGVRGALDGKGLLAAPVAVHAALDHPGPQPLRQFFRAVGAEVVDDQHLVTELYGFDAVFDIALFIFRQN